MIVQKSIDGDISARNDSVDIVKFIGIYLMVLCHCGVNNLFTVWVYSFHMPLFFILSGFTTDINKKIELSSYIEKKFKQIMIPYLCFACILCFGNRNILDFGFLLYGSRNAIASANSCTALWFLPCFFVSSVIYRLVCSIANGKINKLCFMSVFCGIVGVVLSGVCSYKYRYPLNLDMSFVGVFFMFMGYVLKRIVNKNFMRWGG